MRSVMAKLGIKAKDSEINAMLAFADLDDNDGVTLDEFKSSICYGILRVLLFIFSGYTSAFVRQLNTQINSRRSEAIAK